MSSDASLYFAYGSNVDPAHLEARCPGARALGPAVLPDHRLSFAGPSRLWGGGVATLRPRIGAAARGVLWSLRAEHWATLDRIEGAPDFYRRLPVTVHGPRGPRGAWTYLLPGEIPDVAPPEDYLAVLRRGREAWGLEGAALERAVAALRLRRVFVYGTLLRGERNHGALEGAQALGEARTLARYVLVHTGAWPAMRPPRGQESPIAVRGELYGVSEAGLARLDALEGHPGLMRRQPVALAEGAEAEAWLMGRALEGSLLPGGDWRRRVR